MPNILDQIMKMREAGAAAPGGVPGGLNPMGGKPMVMQMMDQARENPLARATGVDPMEAAGAAGGAVAANNPYLSQAADATGVDLSQSPNLSGLAPTGAPEGGADRFNRIRAMLSSRGA